MPANHDFADYCCELLSSAGPVVVKRMFGSWGLSVDGMMLAIVSDRGAGEKLWLKANDATRGRFEAARSERFSYQSHKGAQVVVHDMNYYSAPEDAMDSVHAMAPWARLALESALAARLASPRRSPARKRAVKAGAGKATSKKPQG